MIEETAAAVSQKQDIAALGAANVSTLQTSAAESGVAGQSVDALVSEVLRQQAAASSVVDQNLASTEAQIERQRLGLAAEAKSRIAGVPGANPVATATGVAGAGLGLLNQYRLMNPPKVR